jgi:hypothetical protein
MIPQSWMGTTTVNLPYPLSLIVYIVIWAISIAGLYFIYRKGRSAGFSRWTTQDILIVAIMGVLLEVYDNLIGDQFIRPLTELIPFAHIFAVNDLPYMFLLMVGIALIRKPGAATAMVFLNFILMQLLYSGTGINVLFWPYGIFQGLFVDLYLVLSGGRVFLSKVWFLLVLDGLIMGALRAVPAVTVQSAFLSPFLFGQTQTLGYIFFYSLFNMIGNGVEAAISGPLAVRIARSVNPAAAGPVTTQMDIEVKSVVVNVDGEGSLS